jgi:hypothetical protein
MSDWGTTTRIRAVVTLASGDVYPGYLHLLDGIHYPAGCENLLEMLNRPEGFFPVTLDDGAVFFLARDQVAMVVAEWPPQGVEPPVLPGSPAALQVELANGEEFMGLIQEPLPKDRARALDFLNASQPFFKLETDTGARFINGAHVRIIRPLD